MNIIKLIQTAIGAFVFLVVMLFAWRFIDRMTCVLEQHGPKAGISYGTNTCCQAIANSAKPSAIDPSEKNDSAAIISAYDSLSNELSSWMAIMGIFATVFGLLIPIGSYFLQRQSLKDEREAIMRDVEKSSAEVFVKIQESVDEMPEEMAEKMKPMWNFLAANFDRFLVNDGARLIGNNILDWRLIANFIVEYDICLDCLVRAQNAGRLLDFVCKYQNMLTAVQQNHQKEWQYALERLKDKMQPSKEFVSGREYAAVIGSDSEVYAWLKDFYSQFAPWKFA